VAATVTATMMGTDLVRLHLAAGAPIPAGVVLSPRVQRALSVARLIGAPLLPAVDAAGEAEEDAARALRAVDVASAQARTVATALALAPILLVPLVARLAGTSAVAYYAAPAGRGVLLAGGALLAVGTLVARAIVRSAVRPSRESSVEVAVELVATALTGGSGTAHALRVVAAVLPGQATVLRGLALDVDLGHRRRGTGHDLEGHVRLRELLAEAVELGAPVVPSLRRLARDLRERELARVMASAERLPARLTFPTTLLILPATVLLIAAPLVDAGLRGVVG